MRLWLPSSWAGGGSEQQLVLQAARISWKHAAQRREGSTSEQVVDGGEWPWDAGLRAASGGRVCAW